MSGGLVGTVAPSSAQRLVRSRRSKVSRTSTLQDVDDAERRGVKDDADGAAGTDDLDGAAGADDVGRGVGRARSPHFLGTPLDCF